MPIVYPTHTCFDDALEYIGEMLKNHPAAVMFEDVVLVHAICIMPNGDQYAHAWVESKLTKTAYFFGIVKGGRVRIDVDSEEYRKELQVVEFIEYTPYEACKENYKHGTFGPWKEKYLNLCRDKKKP